jgi:hypothetical protein
MGRREGQDHSVDQGRPVQAGRFFQSAVNESDLLAVAIGRPKKGSADWLLDQRNAFVLLTKRFG